jgi:hypothetical protein
MMKYWDIGIMGSERKELFLFVFLLNPIFHHSIIPLLECGRL